ncbi:MAG TPA: DUF4214 domain-containing protein, partial [Acidimicrobiales bacterium]|nr:DUF4214 domain-containing protein [Acidimicrobiales bacterium]
GLAPSAASAAGATSLEGTELEVVRLHNEARRAAGLAPLDVHVTMHTDARRWSAEMARRQQLVHQTSAAGVASYSQTSCAAADPQWRSCSENVAVGQSSASAVHAAWMASSAHRANLMDPGVNRVGIGVWSDGQRLWWTARYMRGTTADTVDSTAHPQDGGYDPDGPAGTVYRLYRAYFLREPDAAGFEFWLSRYRSGQSLTSIADAFSASHEFRSTYGSVGDRQFVGLVYDNVLGRAPDLAGLQYWLGQLLGGMSRGRMMIGFSDSAEFRDRTADGVPPGY